MNYVSQTRSVYILNMRVADLFTVGSRSVVRDHQRNVWDQHGDHCTESLCSQRSRTTWLSHTKYKEELWGQLKICAVIKTRCVGRRRNITMTCIITPLMYLAATRVLTTLENMEISGNLLILENLGNLKFSQGIYQMLFFRDAICA